MKKKLLYISVNSKPEDLSSSKTVARAFINKFLEKYNDFHVEEVDLYKDHIPRLEYQYFESRNAIIKEEDAEKLDQKDQKEIKRIRELCDQFVDAQVYVIASPMWSLSFPAPLKEYIDCIVQVGKTIEFVNNKPKGLLDNQGRVLVYIESSGGKIPWILDPVMDKGENYVASVMKTLGIKKVEELMVSGTGTTEEERQEAISNAIEKIDEIINSITL
ncbi:FMN-dependent NADH-azoreductase [Romboutsia ilealis]|uniref:FMN dependent NADH:quinone oxidoreductase n=1 Tax=Romboutsia faecis TaxID=2764597 RepID=A0ABR7JNT8_9FIRM|nr:NAD(P)H-dependent oxidoreductase [Romboutsia faecis]MBC5996398.1 NAD(P)H-dependent oxidoreductase [Romboutsia faecis]MRN26023.1 FMN-dependent NADH-azoreductase [Romboutsia ilealis]